MAHFCGCYVYDPKRGRIYLPQIKLDAHTTILSTASRTILTQTFINDSKESLQEIRYAFPLYDGVSVVDFHCQVGERTIYGLVKEKNEARKTYEKAKERGESAALLEQLPNAADVFTTTISNVPQGTSVQISIKYVQELKHDAEVDGVRLNIPTAIAPRYGHYLDYRETPLETIDSKGMAITVDIDMGETTPIQKIMSPSHPIQVTLGSLSKSTADEEQSLSRGSATLALSTVQLEQDFVLQVVAKDVGAPQAILETHPTLPNQRALMTTLVPKFNLKPEKPEIILIADRSGSMEGPNMTTLKTALKVFLKSIPLGCTFNICSFGSTSEFLWDKSQIYDEDTLKQAIEHVETFQADLGGTETLGAIEACFKNRSSGSPTEMILLTDGDIWMQDKLFDYIRQETKTGDARVFPLGIGGGVSSALIEGVARAGRGFAQMVGNNEKMDRKIVRMLKGALTPHIHDYRLEVKYEDGSIDTVADSLRVHLKINDSGDDKEKSQTQAQPISLYDPDAKEENPKESEVKDVFAGLPDLKRPTILQTPHKIPELFPFHRTCIYLLMAPESSHLQPKSVMLKASCLQGPLELEIPVESGRNADEMIHQLAARRAIKELEEGHGWVSDATLDDTGVLLKEKHWSMYALLQRHEAVRLGVEFQVGGKYCSFVAVEANKDEIAKKRQKALELVNHRGAARKDKDVEDWELLEKPPAKPYWPQMQVPLRTPVGANSIVTQTGHRFLKEEREEESDEDEDMGFGLYDDDGPPQCMAEEKEEEEEESDDDMGYGLFDGDGPPPNLYPQHSLLLHHLISLQTFSGAWPSLSALPMKNLHIEPSEALSTLRTFISAKKTPDQLTASKILATALVVCFLEKKMADEEETWELVVDKARTWLQETMEEQDLDEVWRLAKGMVSASEGYDELDATPAAADSQGGGTKQEIGLFD